MIKHNQDGAVSGLGLSLILAVSFLVVAIAFGGWAFASRQDYKDKSDAKSAAAVAIARADEDKVKDAAFAEAAKNPLTTYKGPDAYGSLTVQYPKTWQGYLNAGNKNTLVDGYFIPGIVPSIADDSVDYALRIQILDQPYTAVADALNKQAVHNNMAITAYSLPKMPKVLGMEVVYKDVNNTPTTTEVVLPVRSQTIEIWTDGTQYVDDFNKYVLPNTSFSP